MLEKLKALSESAKNLLLYVLAPFVAVVAGIIYLATKNRDLKQQNSDLKSDLNLAQDKEKSDEASQTALRSLDEYNKLRRAYDPNKPDVQ